MDLTTGAAVLIADVEEAVCFTLAREVRRRGLTPLVASDGVRAVELARTYPGFIVAAVLDLRMPRADGLAVATQVAEVRPGCPVVLMSASHAALAEARNATGVRSVLEKPFELAAFGDHITLFLGEAALRAG